METLNLKPINIDEWKRGGGARDYRGLRINPKMGYAIPGAALERERALAPGVHLLFANSGKRWFVMAGESGGCAVAQDKPGKPGLRIALGKALAVQVSNDLGLRPRQVALLSQDRIPSGGELWYELKADK